MDNGDLLSTARQTAVTITAANDPAQATNLTQAIAYTEGDPSVALDDIVVTDVDDNATITARLTLADPAAGTLTTSATARYASGGGMSTVWG